MSDKVVVEWSEDGAIKALIKHSDIVYGVYTWVEGGDFWDFDYNVGPDFAHFVEQFEEIKLMIGNIDKEWNGDIKQMELFISSPKKAAGMRL